MQKRDSRMATQMVDHEDSTHSPVEQMMEKISKKIHSHYSSSF